MAALPDLSENLINESQTWEEIREIKAMPVPMAQKRELKNQLQVNKSLAEVSMLTASSMVDAQAKNVEFSLHSRKYWQRFLQEKEEKVEEKPRKLRAKINKTSKFSKLFD